MVNITEAFSNVPVTVTFPPILENPGIKDPITLEPGQSWFINLKASDADNDLASIDV
jgi:hypothetical protein